MLHLVNWNVNGIRAILKKEFVSTIQSLNPDVLCLQETKASEEDAAAALTELPGYHTWVNSSKARKGYSGTAILSREEPLRVTFDLGISEFDQEGRVITAEFATWFLVTVYTPNSGEGLSRLEFRKRWDLEFANYLTMLMKRKPVMVCGDLNVAHQPIDLARPKENYNKSAGYTQAEIDGLSHLLSCGFTDTYRALHPDQVQYTYWNFVFNARAKNMGWRIDYFLASEKMMPRVKEALIYDQCLGSDHCPVGVRVDL